MKIKPIVVDNNKLLTYADVVAGWGQPNYANLSHITINVVNGQSGFGIDLSSAIAGLTLCFIDRKAGVSDPEDIENFAEAVFDISSLDSNTFGTISTTQYAHESFADVVSNSLPMVFLIEYPNYSQGAFNPAEAGYIGMNLIFKDTSGDILSTLNISEDGMVTSIDEDWDSVYSIGFGAISREILRECNKVDIVFNN